MKLFTKPAAFLLVLTLLCGMLPAGLTVYAEEPTGEELSVHVNSGETYLTEDEAVELIRTNLLNRVESFTVRVQTESSERSAVISGILDRAMAHTGNGKEGDSLRWQCAWGGEVLEHSVSGGVYRYTYRLSIVYNSSAAQEAELDTAVSNLLTQLALDGKSDYEKVCAVYDYVCANVRYDDAHLGDEAYLLQFTPYAALVNKTAASQGCALLVYRLLLELGVDCRVIGGTGAGETHTWNIAELDGLWYNLDAMWDSGMTEYNWFLKNTWDFSIHNRYLEYETMEFHRAYPMAAESYTEGAAAEMDPIIYAGQCGLNASWLLDRYGDLVIFGKGATWDFGEDLETMPEWKYWADDIVNVIVEDGITRLGDHAFSAMVYVTTVSLSNSLTEIGDYAFESCKGLTDVELPSGLRSIGSYGFSNCSALAGIVIPDGVTAIEEYTFYNCAALKTAALPANLTRIGSNAFRYCSALMEIEIPENVTSISSNAFANCTSLAVIRFLGNAPGIANDSFSGVTATAYYPGENGTWTEDKLQNYGGNITWIGWTHDHVYEPVVTAPTCTEQGYTTHTCAVCGDSYVSDYVAALGHTCSEYVLTLVPTGFKTGALTGTCSVCSESVTVVLPALNSTDYTIEVTLEPTETETGTAIYTWNNTDYGTVSFEVILRSLSDKPPLGDVNGDGNINILDANLAAAYYNEVIDLTEDQILAADVNGDGNVNILDANLIAAYYNEVIEAFPAA